MHCHPLKYLRSSYGLVVFFIFSAYLSQAQSFETICKPEITNFYKQHYKGYDQNWNIIQHPQTKFIYVANSKGLLEYDGSNWEEYDLPDKQKIRSLAVDQSGKLYTGALGEFGYWQPDSKGKLIYHSLKQLINDQKFAEEEIWNIVPTESGIIFQSFAFIYLFSNNSVKKLQPPGSMLFASDVNGEIFIPILGIGVYKLENQKFEFLEGTQTLANESVYSILPDNKGGILIGTEKKIYRYSNQSLTEFNVKTNVFIDQNHLNRGILLPNGKYAFGTILNGLIITNLDGEILYHINQKGGLQNNTVLALAKDKEGDLWIGLDKGIDMIKISSPIIYYNDYPGNLGTVYDAALFENNLYLGTNHGVFYTTLKDKNANFTLVPETQGQVWDLQVFDNQLICGHNKGTFLIQNNKAKLISNINGGWTIKRLQSNPDFLIQGTYNDLCIYKKDKQNQWSFSHKVDGFLNPITQLEEDEKGIIWVNKMGRQIFKIQLSSDLKKAVTVTNIQKIDSSILKLNLSKLGKQIVINTGNNTLIYNNLTDQLEPSTLLSIQNTNTKVVKLFSFPEIGDFILKQDGELNLFVTELNHKNIFINRFNWVDEYENMISIDQHNFLICTDNGFAILPKKSIPDLVVQSTYEPIIRNIEITDFPDKKIAFRQKVNIAALYFSHDENTVNISFSSPGYFGDVKYSYWLENSTKNWSAFENISKKEFINLSPGEYIFHLKSNLSPDETILHFEIKAPWFWNIWSKLFYAIFLVSTLLYLYSLHIKKTKYLQAKALKKLERKLARQEEESKKEILRLKSHQLEQDLIRKSEEIANTTMVLIKKSELLQEIRQELVELKSESNGQSTSKIYNNILHLIDSNITNENDWHIFEDNFNKVHEDFFMKLIHAYPGLSPSDLKLAALLRMNHSSKEIAQLLNITYRSVELKRYRLRKKLDIGAEVNLGEFMIKF